MGKEQVTKEELIRDAVVERFIAGSVSDADEIAEAVGRSVSTVRKVMSKNYGNVPGTLCCNGFDRKTRWTPDASYLAEMIVEMRKQCANKNE